MIGHHTDEKERERESSEYEQNEKMCLCQRIVRYVFAD